MISFSPAHLQLSTTGTFVAAASRRILVFTLTLLLIASAGRAQQAVPVTSQTLYSQGDPTDGEQYLLQQLNRARMDPVGEGQRLAVWLRDTTTGQEVVAQYGTNPDQVISDFAALPAVPPLAFDPHLIAAARGHSTDMVSTGIESHTGSDGSTPPQREAAAGFSQWFAGENAAYPFPSLDEVHAGYLVDWGNPGLGHRQNSMTGTYGTNVIGIGLANEGSSDLLAETEDFGSGVLANKDDPAMLTGVVYDDTNGNGQYDPGEGIAGVTVSMDGGAYYAVTSASGGYSLPLVNADGSNADGTVAVRMTFADGGVFTSTAEIARHDFSYGISGTYRGNVEWDATVADDVPEAEPVDPNLPYFNSKIVTVAAGKVVKIKVFRPSNSDMTLPVTVSYKETGTAVAGADYDALPGTAFIPAGRPTAKIKVTALDKPALNPSTGTITLRLKLKGVAGVQGKITVTFVP